MMKITMNWSRRSFDQRRSQISLPLVNEAVAELFDDQLSSPSMPGTAEPLSHASRLAPARMNNSDDLRNRSEVNDSAPGQMAEKFRTRTPELRTMLKRLEVAARHNVTILLIGETGAGKTHLASLIHEHSTRTTNRSCMSLAERCRVS
jgi:DNA-binding NtrC family response regulator